MSIGAARGRPRTRSTPWRAWCLLGSFALLIVAVVPPLSSAAHRTQYAAAIQFSLLAIAVPALLCIGAPWRRLRLANDPSSNARPRFIDRVADLRRRHRELPRTVAFVAADLGVVLIWRIPRTVAAGVHPGWLGLEAATLIFFGIGLWLEFVASPPMAPRSGPFRRAVLAALVLWAFWINAYVVGMSNHDLYPNFHHVAGHGLSAAADQQIAAIVLWLAATVAFVPIVFWNAFKWLKSEDDPDAELAALRRFERRAGESVTTPAAHRRSGGPAPTP